MTIENHDSGAYTNFIPKSRIDTLAAYCVFVKSIIQIK